MRRMETGGLLPIELLHELHDATLRAGLDRKALLSGIDRRVMMGFQIGTTEGAQILLDLDGLNILGKLEDGTLPLGVWLQNARRLSERLPQKTVFQRALDALPKSVPACDNAESAARSASSPPPPEPPASAPSDTAATDSAADDRRRAEEEEARQRHLTAFKTRVEDLLRKAPALAAALADRGYVDRAVSDPARSIAFALFDKPARQVAADVASLATVPGHRDAARNLLWHILPLAGDWEDILKQARSGAGRGTLELRLRTATVAEIVLARVEARCCLFAPGEEFPQGANHIPLPAVARAPLFDPEGTRLVEAVLLNLWDPEEGPLPAREAWRSIRRQFPDKDDFMVAASAKINAGALLDKRRYLLFIDADLGLPAEDLDGSWAVAQRALGVALPGLRLVRLKGRLQEMKNEAEIAPLVQHVRDLP